MQCPTAVRWLRFAAMAAGMLAKVSPAAELSGYFTDSTSPLALQQPLPTLNATERERFAYGRGLFNQIWVASPSSDPNVDGLGPTFNQSACAACHLRNGRGEPPASPQSRMRGMLLRLSIAGTTDNGGPLPHAVYGDQLQDSSIAGVPAEGRAVVQWVEQAEHFADGDSISLRKPVITLTNMAFGEAGADLLMSARVAPPIVGAGLLDAVLEADIEALARVPRADGIKGRVNHVYDPVSASTRIGRFGWKANAASLMQQTAGAFSGDLGITSIYLPNENCPSVQTACAAAVSQGPDVTITQLAAIVFYQSALAIPIQRDSSDPEVMRGRALFTQAGCHQCHLPELRSGANAVLPALANQHFAAYTDLLLHDMGEALADGRPDFLASGSQWRTAPLWGLGLIPTVNEHSTLLHDGRARGVLEAILWHGGEAQPARERIKAMPREDRQALVHFLNSL